MIRLSAARSRLRLRLVTASGVLSLLVVALASATLLGVLHHEFDRVITARLADRSDALTATISFDRGVVDVTGADEALFDTPNWVFDAAGRRVEGQHVPKALAGAVRSIARTRTTTTRMLPEWQLRAVPVRRAGAVVAVAVTGVDRRPYDASLATVARIAGVFGLLAVIGATVLAGVVLSRGLGPIAAMTEQAASWSRAHSHRRFGLGAPRDEVTGLAAVLDDLLDRVEEALESERRLTAEMAHELRTPLTALRGEAELALLSTATPPDAAVRFERIRDAAVAMSGAITTLLDAERRAGPAGSAATPVLELVEDVPVLVPEGMRLIVTGDRTAAVAASADHLRQIVSPVLDNALRFAAGVVHVEVTRDGGDVCTVVTDDGPGVDPGLESSVFAPGVTASPGGTGLGLGIARRLAAAGGGTVELLSERPATFVIRLPAAPPRDPPADHVR